MSSKKLLRTLLVFCDSRHRLLSKSSKKKICCNLLEQNSDWIRHWFKGFDSVISDGDGVLWLCDEPLQDTVKVMNQFQDLGKKIFLCTNRTKYTQAQFLKLTHEIGINFALEDIICTAHSVAHYLRAIRFKKKAYVIGMAGLEEELDAHGIIHTGIGPDVMEGSLETFRKEALCKDPSIGAVVVGFDEQFSFCKMAKAATYLRDPSCLFLATNTDNNFKTPKAVIPGSGSFLSAVESCAQRKAYVIGKPNPRMVNWLTKIGKIQQERTLVIGDNCATDILLGYNCGFQTLLVGSGSHQLEDVRRFENSDNPELQKLVPDVYLPKLADLLPFMGC